MHNEKSIKEKLNELKKDAIRELQHLENPEVIHQREFDKKLKNLIYIYDNELFEKSFLNCFPIRTLQRTNNPSIRLSPKVLLGFGKYGCNTLFQVYKEDKLAKN